MRRSAARSALAAARSTGTSGCGSATGCYDTLDAAASLGSRIWRTIAGLTIRPGRLIGEYAVVGALLGAQVFGTALNLALRMLAPEA